MRPLRHAIWRLTYEKVCPLRLPIGRIRHQGEQVPGLRKDRRPETEG
jgi:hypothetical protein